MMELFIYEGYLRNRRELCRTLELQPEETWDRTRTEREILCKGWKKWGSDLPGHLLGSFAFAFRDAESGDVFCARDAFGIRTLYYHVTADGQLLCGTDLSGIVRHETCSKAIDMDALRIFLTLGYPAGERTLYQDVRKLMPGHRMRYTKEQGGRIAIDRWFSPVFRPDKSLTEDAWAGQIDRTMQEILADDRFNMDYDRGTAFLSGGVDSSYLLASSGMKTACGIGFTEGKADELSLAKATAGRLDTDFYQIRIGSTDFLEKIPDFVRQTELPLSDASSICFFAGCEYAAKMASFVYSGEGADEFFAGYHVYRRAEELALDGGPLHYGCDGVMEWETAARLLRLDGSREYEELVEEYYEQTADSEHLSRLLMIDIGLWLEGDILLGAGRSARGCGLELLLPYADQRMFELSARIPSLLKRTEEHGKYILRRAAEQRIPKETAFRAKAGFPNPALQWFRSGRCRSEMEDILFGDEAGHFFDRELLQSFWEAYQGGDDRYFRHVFTVYIFIIWYNVCYKNGVKS